MPQDMKNQTVDEAQDSAVNRNSAIMSALVIVCRITGFIRTWAQAFALGATTIASCYTVASNLPNLLYDMVTAGLLTTAFLPVYLSVKRKLGDEESQKYASNITSLVVIIMGLVSVLGFIFAAQVVYTQSAGAQEDFSRETATYFFRFFVIEVLLYALSSLVSGLLNADRHFSWSQAAPIFNNVICIASFFGYSFFASTNMGAAMLCLAIGNPLGVLVQVLIQIPSLKKRGIKLRPYVNLRDPALKETIAIAAPAFLTSFLSFIVISIQSSCMLSVTASASAISYYARLWYALPYSVLAIPVTITLFTELSDAYSKDDMPSFKNYVMQGCSRIMFWTVPFLCFLIAFGPQLIAIVNPGKFSVDEYWMAVSYLGALATALPFYALNTFFQKVCSSCRHLIFFAVASLIGCVIQAAICIIFTPMFGINVDAYSSTIFFAFVDILTYLLLSRLYGGMGLRAVAISAVKIFILGILGALVGWGIVQAATYCLNITDITTITGILLCVAGGIPALIVTYSGSMLLHMPEAAFIKQTLRRFLPL